MDIVELYSVVDNFCKIFMEKWKAKMLSDGVKKRNRLRKMSVSEIMTIVIFFHQSNNRNFKNYYLGLISEHYKNYFPDLLSYPRFLSIMKSILVPLCSFVQSLSGKKTGIYFIDSTLLKACHIKREKQNKVFAKLARKSKSSMGWFFGFKLHIVINDKGEIMAFKITKGNVDDRKPVPFLVKGLQLVTKIKSDMKNKLMHLVDKILLRKRAIIESVNDQLKNISQIEHTRHRSPWNFACNLIAGLCAYSLQPKKPSISTEYPCTQILC